MTLKSSFTYFFNTGPRRDNEEREQDGRTKIGLRRWYMLAYINGMTIEAEEKREIEEMFKRLQIYMEKENFS